MPNCANFIPPVLAVGRRRRHTHILLRLRSHHYGTACIALSSVWCVSVHFYRVSTLAPFPKRMRLKQFLGFGMLRIFAFHYTGRSKPMTIAMHATRAQVGSRRWGDGKRWPNNFMGLRCCRLSRCCRRHRRHQPKHRITIQLYDERNHRPLAIMDLTLTLLIYLSLLLCRSRSMRSENLCSERQTLHSRTIFIQRNSNSRCG